MKKFFLTPAILFFLFSVQAQLVNGNFENWTTRGNHLEPDGWSTSNTLLTMPGLQSVWQDLGAFATIGAHIQVVHDDTISNGSGPDVPGVMKLGGSFSAPGVAFSQTDINALTFWVRGELYGFDSLHVEGSLTKSTLQGRKIAATFNKTFNNTTDQDSLRTVPVTWYSKDFDSLFISLSVGYWDGTGFTGEIGSYVVVDSMLFTTGLPLLPEVPAVLAAYDVSDNFSPKVRLQWLDNSAFESAMLIERSTGYNGPFTVVDSTDDFKGSVFMDSAGLAYSTKYYYRVAALNYGEQAGYSNIDSVTTGSFTGILPFGILHPVIYPNPNSGSFTMVLPREAKEARIWVSNMLGQIIWQQKTAQNTVPVNLPPVSSGRYIVRIETDRGLAIKPLIVK